MALEYRIVPKNRYWWILVLGFFFAAYDAFGIGSNDVANSVRARETWTGACPETHGRITRLTVLTFRGACA